MKLDGQQVPTYKNNFFAAQKGVEGVIIMTTLKQIISRFMNSQEELRQPENMVIKRRVFLLPTKKKIFFSISLKFFRSLQGLYSDVRSMMNFLQENHGHPFRLVELSALLDAMQAPSPTESKTEYVKIVFLSINLLMATLFIQLK